MAGTWYKLDGFRVWRDAMASPQFGVIQIEVDGEWDITDLADLSDSLAESYGFLYPLVETDEEVRVRLHDLIRKQFWSGDIETRNFGRALYAHIPKSDGLKVRSFSYASPGVFEIGGAIGCFLMLAKIARAYIAGASEFIDLWKKVDEFFETRKHLRRPKKKTAVDDSLALNSDEASKLCEIVCEKLGFDGISCGRIIEIAGNPISALKFLVALGKEGNKLARLQNEGLLKLPPLNADVPVSEPPKSGRRIGRAGIPVETKGRRRPKS